MEKKIIRLTTKQKKALKKIKKICSENRLLSVRFKALRNAGFEVSQRPMGNGGGIGNYIEVNGIIRVRVSYVWGTRFSRGSYSNCVHI